MNRGMGIQGALIVAGIAALIAAAPAAATVTVGQVAPAPASGLCTQGDTDILNPSVPSGTSYVSPVTGTLTSWSSRSMGVLGHQLTMKVFRKISDPANYQAVAHDGPRDLGATAGVTTFSGLSIPVKAGDVVGINSANASGADHTPCVFDGAGVELFHVPGLADGASDAFTETSGVRGNVSATIEPDNAITLGAITRNRKAGTATINLTVPNPGELTGAGKGVKASSARESKSVPTAGPATLLIKAKGKAKKKLNAKGKAKLTVQVTYTPTGGQAKTTPVKVKLKKKR